MKILMVLTSHDRLGDTGQPTGFWLEELAAPYYVFMAAGADITLAAPTGGHPPLDPKSDDPGAQTDETRRKQLLSPYAVDDGLMAKAAKGAVFMHCLPAYRGLEVSASVIDGPQSVVFDEAENRLHAQKAILAWCLGVD